MSRNNRSNPTSNQYRNGLSYNAHVPAFLQALKQQVDGGSRNQGGASHRARDDRSVSPPGAGSNRRGRDRSPRRSAGQSTNDEDELDEFGRTIRRDVHHERSETTNRSSDHNRKHQDHSDDGQDEWERQYMGSTGDEGPQIVVVKEGKHLSADEFAREKALQAGGAREAGESE